MPEGKKDVSAGVKRATPLKCSKCGHSAHTGVCNEMVFAGVFCFCGVGQFVDAPKPAGGTLTAKEFFEEFWPKHVNERMKLSEMFCRFANEFYAFKFTKEVMPNATATTAVSPNDVPGDASGQTRPTLTAQEFYPEWKRENNLAYTNLEETNVGMWFADALSAHNIAVLTRERDLAYDSLRSTLLLAESVREYEVSEATAELRAEIERLKVELAAETKWKLQWRNRVDELEAELTRLRGQGLANELIGCGLCEWRGKLRDFQVHHKTHVVPQSPEQGAPELLPLAIEWRKTNWYDSVPQQLDQALAAFAAYVLDPERAVPQLPAKPLTGESNMGFGKQAGKEDSSQ